MDCSVLLHPTWLLGRVARLTLPNSTLLSRVLMQSVNDDLARHPIRRHSTSWVALATCCLTLFAGASAFGQVLRGQAAMGDWRDDKPGLRRLLTAQDLPAVAKPTAGQAKVVPMPPDARPQVPDGFTAELVTTDTHKPRVIRVAPSGDLFVADSMFGSVRVLRVPAGSAKPAKDVIFASGLQQPYGIAFYPPGPNPRWVYVANSDGVVRFA
jgi:glucose/arabinose dehydrogenase